MNLPEKFEQRMQHLLGQEEFEEYQKSLEKSRVYGLRTNTLKIAPEELEKKLYFSLSPVQWCKEGFYYEEKERPAKHPYYHAGLYYLQEPSAMAPGSILEIEPGERVLDICAAPGGKSTQLGAKLQGKGILIANDISATRAKALLKNIELFGIKNAVILNETPKKLAERFYHYFDKILIDAPCSGEGMFRKEPDVIKSWGDKMTEFCCRQQQEILEQAATMLRGGGCILYSTCTFAPEENEQAIQNFLDRHTEFEILPISEKFGFEQGKPEWIAEGRQELKGCARLFPHKIKGEGHFLAVLHHKEEERKSTAFPAPQCVPEKELQDFFAFSDQYLNLEWKGKFQLFKEDLYLLPEETPDLSGIHIVRNGWYLGKRKKNRFEPSQAMAMGLKKEEAKITIDFSVDDPALLRYLKGETLEREGIKDGWTLVLADGFPVGWGKAQGGRLKNKYLPGWRY